MSSTDKSKLNGIAKNANNYSLPTASDTVLGGIKVGSRLSIASGVLSATQQTANDFTTVLKNKLDGIESNANNYSLPTASDTVIGGVKVGARLTIVSGTLSADSQTENDFTTVLKTKLDGIESGANNYTHPTTAGNKHIPTGGATNQILRYSASGTAVWSAEKNTTYGVVTTAANGLMIAADKVKLNDIEEGAN